MSEYSVIHVMLNHQHIYCKSGVGVCKILWQCSYHFSWWQKQKVRKLTLKMWYNIHMELQIWLFFDRVVHSPWWVFLFSLAFLVLVLWPSSTSSSYCSLPPHLTLLVAIAFMWSLGLTLHPLSRASYVHSPCWVFLLSLAFLLMVLWPSSTSSLPLSLCTHL